MAMMMGGREQMWLGFCLFRSKGVWMNGREEEKEEEIESREGVE